ncbi:hypothetical protein [Thiococcus pfennigii]|uniref:hypothetical protein n=1 Tax=Thiococcus pfennigii TaxID=1057 RepID=UPI00190820E7|nr:hypothetical protein [Thiococcus pfennigii]
MSFTVCLTPEEQALLERVSRQSARSQDDLVRQGIRELCQRLLAQTGPTPYETGRDLFGAGHLAEPPTDPAKRQIWEALHAKHGRLG